MLFFLLILFGEGGSLVKYVTKFLQKLIDYFRAEDEFHKCCFQIFWEKGPLYKTCSPVISESTLWTFISFFKNNKK